MSIINSSVLLILARKTEYVVMDDDQEVPIKVRHDEKSNFTKI